MKLRQGGDFIEKPASLTLDIELRYILKLGLRRLVQTD